MKGIIEMLKRNWHIVAILIVLAGVSGLGFKGCSPDDKARIEQHVRTGVRISAAAAVEVKAELDSYCRAELLTPESCAQAQPHATKIAAVAERINKFAQNNPKLTPETRDEALAMVDELIAELDALEFDGVIEFKDPEKRKKFLRALAIGRSSTRVARVALAEIKLEQPSPSPSPAQ